MVAFLKLLSLRGGIDEVLASKEADNQTVYLMVM